MSFEILNSRKVRPINFTIGADFKFTEMILQKNQVFTPGVIPS